MPSLQIHLLEDYPCACVGHLPVPHDIPLLTLDSLTEHATNKHSKTLADCFPDFKDPTAELKK